MNKKKFLRNTVIYFLLIVGFVYLYIADIETIIFPESEDAPKSKVTFVYQQF